MRIQHKAHFDAFKDIVEMIAIAGWIALLTDLAWVARDWVLQGYPVDLVFIFSGLFVAFVILTYGVVAYHRKLAQNFLRATLKEKLRHSKLKFKHSK